MTMTSTTTTNSSPGSSQEIDNEMKVNIAAIVDQHAFQRRKVTDVHQYPFHESSAITPMLRSRRYCRSIFLGSVVVVILVQCCAFIAMQKYWEPTTIWKNSHSSEKEAQSLLRPRFQENPKGMMIRPYQLWTSEDIYERLHEWTQEFPRLVELTSAQEEYNLPGAGEDSDCPFEEHSRGCKTWILTIRDKAQSVNEQRHSMPQVLLSGALHGDEVVGPTTVMETAHLLLEAATCESLPQGRAWNGTYYVALSEEELKEELQLATNCREALAKRGVFPVHRKWLARLVTTRTIIVVPSANALGYFRRTRKEGDIDPNRDFPFDRNNDTNCLESIAGRSLYQLLTRRIVQMTITFHAGTEAVAFEWGAPSRMGVAPDAVSQFQISNLYSRYAGALPGGKEYPVGTMNKVVYSVQGGLEDWSYAASWDKDLVQTICKPEMNGGYDASLQPATNSYSLRMFTVLVETSVDKGPVDSTLGTNQDAFTPLGGGNGHISRNIRLSLGMIDLVEPYVQLLGVNGLEIWDDIVPLSPRLGSSCEKTKVISLPFGTSSAEISWTVGGAFTVDHTSLWYGLTAEFEVAPFHCGTKVATQDEVNSFVQESFIRKTDPVYGKTHWHEDVDFPTPGEEALRPLETVFKAHINLASFHQGDRITVYAVARVDQEWSEQRQASLPPQTHIARVRTDPTWRAEDGTGVVQGRLDWLSIPLTIEIGSPTSIMQEMSVRNPFDDWTESETAKADSSLSLGSIYRALVASILVTLLVCSCVICREDNDGTEVWSVWMKAGRHSVPTSDYDGDEIYPSVPSDLELVPNREMATS